MQIGKNMAYFVKVIPPSGRARVHEGSCKFCRDGQGMENQDKGSGPTYWRPKHPAEGFETITEANQFVGGLAERYKDIGHCSYCMREQL